MTLMPTQSSGPVRLSNAASQITATIAGAAAGGLLGTITATRFTRSMFEAGGKARLGAIAIAAAAGLAGAGVGGVSGAQLGADMPGPGRTALSIAAGAALGVTLAKFTRNMSMPVGAAAGTLIGLASARIAGPEVAAPLETVTKVDLNQYAGKWYEVARIPTPFQAAQTVSTAEYAGRPDGSVAVHNTSYLNGKITASIDGSAVPVTSQNDRLNVGFGGFLKLIPKADEGNYWVMDLTDDYKVALVGSPDRKTLFLLARDQHAIDSPDAKQMLEHARKQGFDVDSMLIADWDRQETRAAAG